MEVSNDSVAVDHGGSALLDHREHFAEPEECVDIAAWITEQPVVNPAELFDSSRGRIARRTDPQNSRVQLVDVLSLPLQLSGVRKADDSAETAQEEDDTRMTPDSFRESVERRMMARPEL